MDPIYKYPRTRHVEGSGIQTGDDDLQVAPWRELAGKYWLSRKRWTARTAGSALTQPGGCSCRVVAITSRAGRVSVSSSC